MYFHCPLLKYSKMSRIYNKSFEQLQALSESKFDPITLELTFPKCQQKL